MRAKVFNPQVFLEFICYFFFGGLMLFLVTSGKYLSYVTPRMKPYIIFAAIIMLIWGLFSLFRMFRPQHITRSAHCFVLAVPALLLLLPHSMPNSSELAGGYSGGNIFIRQPTKPSQNQTATTGHKPPTITAPAAASSETAATAVTTAPSEAYAVTETAAVIENNISETTPPYYEADLPGLDTKNKRIVIPDDYFLEWLSEIYINSEDYQGYTIVMTGFVFTNPETLAEDEFVPARLMMSCCAADLAPTGMICKYDNVASLKKDSWVTVEGILFTGVYEHLGEIYDEPQIRVTKITPAEPVEGYIYPY